MHTIASDRSIPVPALAATPAAPRVPWHVWAVLFASTSVVVGVLWDISWHQSIGRDTFWSPPHMAIYLGGVVAGLACAWHILGTSFRGTPQARAATVRFWGIFHGSLGAWMSVWGAIAMLTSAPFDDWWHNAYGLDVKILSPPHALLALGILGIQVGALFMVLAWQNRFGDDRRLRVAYVFAAGLVLLNFATMASEYTWRMYQHGTLFYQVAAGALPIVLAAAAVSARLRWGATATAGVYMGVLLLLTWIFPLFPAEPKLAPIRFDLTRMMPPQFPLLLLVPALAIDMVVRRWGDRPRGWGLAAALGPVFVATFAAVQWPFAVFLSSPLAHNAVFAQHLRPYMLGPDTFFARGDFIQPASGVALATGLAIAALIAVASVRLGLACGSFMRRVRR